MLLHLFNTVEGLVYLTVALKTEGDGDNAYGEDAHLLGDARNDGCCTRSGTTTHAGGDKGHAGAVVQHLLDVFQTLLCGHTGLLGTVTGTKTFLAQLQMNGNRGVVECLIVGVAEYEGHVVDALAIHVVDGIAATASYTNHLDDAFLSFWLAEVEQYVIIHTISIINFQLSTIN